MNEKLKAEVESILFASAKITTIEELVKLTDAKEKDIRVAIKKLSEDYEEGKSSLSIADYDDAWKLTVKDKYMPFVEKVVTETELPKSILETLAVIAFKHPILQSEVVKIRSNKAYDHLKALEDTGFIKREKYGRTNKIHLTQKFFDYFDLPPSKIKEAFSSFNAVARAIDEQEQEIEDMNKKAVEGQEKLGRLEVYEGEKAPERIQEGQPDPGKEGQDVNEDEEDFLESQEEGFIGPEETDAEPEEDKEEDKEEEPEEEQQPQDKGEEPIKATVLSEEDKEEEPQDEEQTSKQEDYKEKTAEEIQAEIDEELKERDNGSDNLSGEQLDVANLNRKISDRAKDLMHGKESKEDKENRDLESLYDQLEDTKDELKN